MPPLFSIIIPVYRSGPFLRDCLDSIRNQTLDGLGMHLHQ